METLQIVIYVLLIILIAVAIVIGIKLIGTLNKGMSLVKGKYIARMDADDICFPQRFAKQVDRRAKDYCQLDFCIQYFHRGQQDKQTSRIWYDAEFEGVVYRFQ